MKFDYEMKNYYVVVSTHGFIEFYDNRFQRTETIKTTDPTPREFIIRTDNPIATFPIGQVTEGEFKYDSEADTIYHNKFIKGQPEFHERLGEILRTFIAKQGNLSKA